MAWPRAAFPLIRRHGIREIRRGVAVTKEPDGGVRFEVKSGAGEWEILDGPTIMIPARDKFSLDRRLFLSCAGNATNAAGVALQIRAVVNGHGYARNLSPHAYWDASLELADAAKFHGWAQLEGTSSIPSDCSKLTFEIWLAVPKAGTSSFSLRDLEFDESFTRSSLIEAVPSVADNIFFSGSGLMKIEFADAASVTDWSARVVDENDKVLFEQSGKNPPAPLSVPLTGMGFYRIVAASSYANGTKLQNETTAAVVGEPLADAVRMNSRFGTDSVHGDRNLWKMSGCRWDWVLQRISLQDWVLNSDGSVSPPPGWVPLTLPADYTPLYGIASYPKWLNGPQTGKLSAPANWTLYEKLFEAFAKANPDIKFFSTYNEGNACWNGSIDDFIKFNTEMAVGAHRGNPQVKVYGPCTYSINLDDFEKYQKAGMFDVLDGVNIHAYVDATPPEDEFIDRVIRMCASLKAAGHGDMPVYLSEFGWNSPPGDWQKTISEQTRAQYVARSLSLLAAQPVDNITYFCFQYITPAGCGYNLIGINGRPTPSYAVYVNTVKWLSEIKRGDARWFRLSPNVNMVLGKAGQRIIGVAWTCEGEETFEAPDAPLRITDMMGRLLPSGSATLKITPSPMFFELPKTCQFIDLEEAKQLQAIPGSTIKLSFSGASSMPGLKVSGGSLAISPAAKPGSYLFIGRTKSGGWRGQPVQVLTPVDFKPLESEVSADGSRLTEFAEIISRVNGRVKATLTLESGQSTIAETKISEGGQGRIALNVPGFKNGARMKGTVAVDSLGAVPFHQEQPFDRSVLNTPVLEENANGEVDWSRIPAIDISQWGSQLDLLGKLRPDLKEIAASDCSALLKVAVGTKGFHLHVEVTDDVHLQTKSAPEMWMEDSLQFNFDVDASKEWQYNNIGGGLFNGHRIFGYGVALPSNSGAPLVWRWRADCPGFAAGRTEPSLVPKISRQGNVTTYDILIPWTALGLTEAPRIGSQMGFSLLVNDADKGGDRHELEFGGGVRDNRPEAYGTLRVIKGK